MHLVLSVGICISVKPSQRPSEIITRRTTQSLGTAFIQKKSIRTVITISNHLTFFKILKSDICNYQGSTWILSKLWVLQTSIPFCLDFFYFMWNMYNRKKARIHQLLSNKYPVFTWTKDILSYYFVLFSFLCNFLFH